MFRHVPATAAAVLLILSGSAVAASAQASSVDRGNDCEGTFARALELSGADVDLAGFAAVADDLGPLLAEFYERGEPFGEQQDRLYYGALEAGVDEFEDFEDGLDREIAAELALVEQAEADLLTQQDELAEAQEALEAAADDDEAAAAQARIDAAADAIGSLEAEITERNAEIEFLRGVPEGLAEATAQIDAIAAELQPRLEALIGTDSGVEAFAAFNSARQVLEDCADEIDALLAADQTAENEDDVVAPVATPVTTRASFTG